MYYNVIKHQGHLRTREKPVVPGRGVNYSFSLFSIAHARLRHACISLLQVLISCRHSGERRIGGTRRKNIASADKGDRCERGLFLFFPLVRAPAATPRPPSLNTWNRLRMNIFEFYDIQKFFHNFAFISVSTPTNKLEFGIESNVPLWFDSIGFDCLPFGNQTLDCIQLTSFLVDVRLSSITERSIRHPGLFALKYRI